MRPKIRLWLAVLVPIALTVRPVAAEVTEQQVQSAIRAGVGFLQKEQRADGSWSGHPGYPGGVTALCTLALLSSGVPPDAAEMQLALHSLRSLGPPEMVYSTALQTMVFCMAEPDKDRLLIARNVQWLEQIQIKAGPRRGSWKYSERRGSGDNSNTQFAMLALYEAERIGVSVSPETWKLALDYWERTQNEDGSWGYFPGEAATGSMTNAGIASVIIAQGVTAERDATVSGDQVECCGSGSASQSVQRGLDWLASKFSVSRNPNPVSDQAWLYYYLYGVERVGRLSGRRFIGRHDWFREGAEFLVRQQDPLTGFWRGEVLAEENALVASSFALLFLSKGRRPVVVSRLEHGGGDWNLHRHGIQNLTQRLELHWKRDLAWQNVDLKAATPEDLLVSPVLFLSGRNRLELTNEQKDNLKQYIARGGFLFAEAACGGEAFDTSFRNLMKELFPDSTLNLLPAEHPVWFAEQKVEPHRLRPLYGVDACCRTSVVYCPTDLSCYWELQGATRGENWPQEVRDEIEACVRIGLNVLTYATNRELKSKLDRPLPGVASASEQPRRGVLYVPKLLHREGGDETPNALPNLLNFVAQTARMRVGVENRTLQADDPQLAEYPIVFMHGRGDFHFTAAERAALKEFLDRGGFVLADAICGSPEFARAFRREFEALAGSGTFARIAPDHPLFTRQYGGFELSSVTIRDPRLRRADDPLGANLEQSSPLLEGLHVSGRLAAVLSPLDLSCALENATSLECKGYVREDAARLGLNVILFALQQ